MQYEYKSITKGVFKFTIPGENRTVELFLGQSVIVGQKLAGSYLRLLSFVREIPEATNKVKKTTTQKAKVADKITAVVETPDAIPTEAIAIDVQDNITTIDEVDEKPAPKRRGRKKKTS